MKPVRWIAPLLMAASTLPAQGTSRWVYFGRDHRLQYRADAQGNRIMDFSFAGYQGGGVPLPATPVAKTLSAVGGDNTSAIQAAIDEVSGRAPDARGLRGAVLLRPGSYEVAGTLTIGASGVVLRGSGSGDRGTTIKLTGPPHRFLDIRGSGAWEAVGNSTPITDAYVPAGIDSFQVERTAGLRVGDTVLVRRPVTEAWIHFMGMDTLVRDGKEQTWIKAGSFIRTDRAIQSISGNRIRLDVPLSDSFDSKFLNPPGPTLIKYTFPGRIAEVGVESLRVVAPGQDAPITEAQYTVLRMDAVIDGWPRTRWFRKRRTALR